MDDKKQGKVRRRLRLVYKGSGATIVVRSSSTVAMDEGEGLTRRHRDLLEQYFSGRGSMLEDDNMEVAR